MRNYLGPRGDFNYGLRVFSLTRQEQALILCIVLSLAAGSIIKQCRRATPEQPADARAALVNEKPAPSP